MSNIIKFVKAELPISASASANWTAEPMASNLLPQGTVLGKLEILEIYESYDKPCLFSCRNVAGQIFLAVWISEDLDSDTWLYAPISLERLQIVAAGGIDLKSAFLEAEDGFVFEAVIAHYDGSTGIIKISCDNLDEDKLPLSGEFLNY